MDNTVDQNEFDPLKDNYYQFFSIDKDANQNEINSAYRRLSKIYHPDRHEDSYKKEQASIIFNKVNKIHGVLSDSQKRAIYDTIGEKGLVIGGWELIEKFKTSEDIRKEFERMSAIEMEKKNQMLANPRGNITITLNATDLFSPYNYNDSYFQEYSTSKSNNIIFNFIRAAFNAIDSIHLMSMSINQSVESQLTQKDNLQLASSVNTKNGAGAGEIATLFRRIHSPDKWSEIEASFGNDLTIGFKHFRSLSTRMYINGSILSKIMSDGTIFPGLQLTLSRQLDKYTTGQLTWKAGLSSAMGTAFIRQTPKSRFVISFQLGIPHSYISLSYSRQLIEDLKIKSQLKFGTFGAMIEYGCEQRLTQHTVVGAYMSVGVPFGVNITLKMNRANQNFSFVTLLCQELLPAPIIIGTLAPYLAYFTISYFIVQPYMARQDKKKLDEEKEFFADKLFEKKKEAEASIDLMKESYNKIKTSEKTRMGLIINKALYGNLSSIPEYQYTISGNAIGDSSAADVTVPLQCLVQDSRLNIPKGSKADLPGFYDVCYGEPKTLYINYEYRTILHEVIFCDEDCIKLPSTAHKTIDLSS
ncbi:unnamed protein product [Gordionus sp. m RMFG-2023]